MQQFGSFFDDINTAIHANQTAAPLNLYPGAPITSSNTPSFLDELKPGGSYFPVAVFGGVAVAGLLIFLMTRKKGRKR